MSCFCLAVAARMTSTAIDVALLIRLSESKTRLVASDSSLYWFCSITVLNRLFLPIYILKSIYLSLGLGCKTVLLCLSELYFTLATTVWGWKSTTVYETRRVYTQ